MADLGTLGRATSFGVGINDAGQVAGYSQTTGGATHAFRTAPNAVINPSLMTSAAWSKATRRWSRTAQGGAGGNRGLLAQPEELVTAQNPSMALARRNVHLLHRRVSHCASTQRC